MSWQLVQLAQVPPAPWHNGGGVTRELLAWPPPDTLAWRILDSDGLVQLAGDDALWMEIEP